MPTPERRNTPSAPEQLDLQVVITGVDILAYTYVRELHRAYGLNDIIILATEDVKMLSESRFTDYRIVKDLFDPECYVGTLIGIARETKAADPERKLLVLGTDDRHAQMLSANKERLEEAGYVVPYIDADLFALITNKHAFYDICESLGIPYPRTWYYPCGEDAPEALPSQSFQYPLILKPADSAKFTFAEIENKRKIYEIDSPEELDEVWETIRRSDYQEEIMIQEFVPGEDEMLRSFTAFIDCAGDVRIAVGGQVCLQDHCPTALGNPVCIMGDPDPVIAEYAERFLKHVGYRGFANFDVKYDPHTGTPYFFEVNARCGRNSYYMNLAGANFVTAIVQEYVLGETVPRLEAAQPFVYCVVPKVVLKKSIKNKALLDEVLANLRQTEDPSPLFNPDDTLKHNLWTSLMHFNHIRKFKKYCWDTNGKQYKEPA